MTSEGRLDIGNPPYIYGYIRWEQHRGFIELAAMKSLELPLRSGPKPDTTRPSRTHATPHKQISQNAPPDMQEELFARASSLAGVSVGDSLVSVPGARAFHLDEALAARVKPSSEGGNSRICIRCTTAVSTSRFRGTFTRKYLRRGGVNRIR